MNAYPKTRFTVIADAPVKFTLKLRHPQWVKAGELTFKIGNKVWSPNSKPSSYVEINRMWKNGDVLEVSLPMHTTIERMPNVSDYVAVLHGPIVLAAKTGKEDLKGLVADNHRWAHIAHGQLLPLDSAPMFVINDISDISRHLKPVDNTKLAFRTEALIQPNTYQDLILEPFFRIHDARYMMYWHVISPETYDEQVAATKLNEQQRLVLDTQTTDRVIPGEQQPEADHHLQSKHSSKGTFRNLHFRHAQAPGWFSYDLHVDPKQAFELFVLYWGRESGQRTFDILIDGEKLVTENLAGKWNRERFVEVRYPLPKRLLKDENAITVCFKPNAGSYAGGIFDLRIVRAD